MTDTKHPPKPPTGTDVDENSQRGSYGESVQETPLNVSDTVPPPPPGKGDNHESGDAE